MAHKKPTEYTVKIDGASCIIIWRTGYKEFIPGKELIYRKAHEEGGRVIWRIAAVRGHDKKGVLHLKYLGLKKIEAPIRNKRGGNNGKEPETYMQELPENAWGMHMFAFECSISN